MNGITSLNTVLLYLGAAILFIWGVAHILPTRNVVASFGPLSEDNRINITMEWVAEGLALAFVGVLAALVTSVGGAGDPIGRIVVWAIGGFCVRMGARTCVVGRRGTILPVRLCPLVMAVVACLLGLGNLL
jgi:hypothetical protein